MAKKHLNFGRCTIDQCGGRAAKRKFVPQLPFYSMFLCDVTLMNHELNQFDHLKNWMWCLLPNSSLWAFLWCLNTYYDTTQALKQWWMMILCDLIHTIPPAGTVQSSWDPQQTRPSTLLAALSDFPRLRGVTIIQRWTMPSQRHSPKSFMLGSWGALDTVYHGVRQSDMFRLNKTKCADQLWIRSIALSIKICTSFLWMQLISWSPHNLKEITVQRKQIKLGETNSCYNAAKPDP